LQTCDLLNCVGLDPALVVVASEVLASFYTSGVVEETEYLHILTAAALEQVVIY